MYQVSVRMICVWFVAIGVAVSGLARDAWGLDDYVYPPQAEREAVAELRAKGAILQVDGNYRVYSVVLLSNCTNEDLKRLAALESLTNLQLQSPRITDDGIDYLKALPKLTSIMVSSANITDAGIAAVKAGQPNLRVTRPVRRQAGCGMAWDNVEAAYTATRAAANKPQPTRRHGLG